MIFLFIFSWFSRKKGCWIRKAFGVICGDPSQALWRATELLLCSRCLSNLETYGSSCDSNINRRGAEEATELYSAVLSLFHCCQEFLPRNGKLAQHLRSMVGPLQGSRPQWMHYHASS